MKMLAKKIVFCQKQFFSQFSQMKSHVEQSSKWKEQKRKKRKEEEFPMIELDLWETDEHLSEHDTNIEHAAYTKLNAHPI